MDFVELTERFIATTYPGAQIALIGGSTARGERTTTSDIDLLIIGDDLFADGATGSASTHRFEDEVFEVFAYTPEGFAQWAERDLRGHRPVIVRMLLDGIPVRSDDRLDALRERWAAALGSGPRVSGEELALRRYVITDLLDDLRDATDPLEQTVIAALLYERVAELMLLASGHWIGAGKWLPRLLRELDRTRADALGDPLIARDHALFAVAVERELTWAGGRVQDGFVR